MNYQYNESTIWSHSQLHLHASKLSLAKSNPTAEHNNAQHWAPWNMIRNGPLASKHRVAENLGKRKNKTEKKDFNKNFMTLKVAVER